jgi:DNA-binding MarR family transcriptional regulator
VTRTEAATAQLAHELRETVGRLVRRLRAEPGGPPVGQLAVLGRLDREGPASISDLAAADRMRPQSMAQTVRDLEEAGLVSRRPDPADARRAFVELTAAGIETLRTTRARREDWLTRTLDRDLDAGERELLRRAVALLSRVANA